MFKTRFTCRNEVKMHYRIDQKTRRLDDQQPATSRPTDQKTKDQKTRRPEDKLYSKKKTVLSDSLSNTIYFIVYFLKSCLITAFAKSSDVVTKFFGLSTKEVTTESN